MSEIDCEKVLQLVWQFLDGEMDEVHYKEIEAHVADCANCEPVSYTHLTLPTICSV